VSFSTFKADCPRCGTRHVMFWLDQRLASHDLPDGKHDFFARCGHCDRGVVATYHDHHPTKNLDGRPDEIAPSFPDTRAPPHTPKKAMESYRQGMENLPGNPDAAGAMFRKTLEVALYERFPDLGGKSLKERIEIAAGKGHLTRDLADWADHIRLDGNNAVHEDITSDQVRNMRIFTELVLRYLFELPGMLEEARQGKSDPIDRGENRTDPLPLGA